MRGSRQEEENEKRAQRATERHPSRLSATRPIHEDPRSVRAESPSAPRAPWTHTKRTFVSPGRDTIDRIDPDERGGEHEARDGRSIPARRVTRLTVEAARTTERARGVHDHGGIPKRLNGADCKSAGPWPTEVRILLPPPHNPGSASVARDTPGVRCRSVSGRPKRHRARWLRSARKRGNSSAG